MRMTIARCTLTTAAILAASLSGCGGEGEKLDNAIQGNSQTVTIATTAADWSAPAGMALVWSDEFDGGSIDTSVWSYETEATGWKKEWNNELQDYLDDGTGGKNAFIARDGDDSCLAIKATKTGTSSWASARLVTKGKKHWKHGAIAARMKLPKGQGIWPAFWMLPETGAWPAGGEIDVMEMIGGGARRDNLTYGTVHGPGYSGPQGIQGSVILASGDFSDAYHVFEVRWHADGISWYVDGALYHEVAASSVPGSWPFNDSDFYVLFNLAVGGGWPGNPDATTVFPQTMLVDWIRVYQ